MSNLLQEFDKIVPKLITLFNINVTSEVNIVPKYEIQDMVYTQFFISDTDLENLGTVGAFECFIVPGVLSIASSVSKTKRVLTAEPKLPKKVTPGIRQILIYAKIPLLVEIQYNLRQKLGDDHKAGHLVTIKCYVVPNGA